MNGALLAERLAALEASMATNWIFWVFGVVVLALLGHLIAARLFGLALKHAERTSNVWDDAVIYSLRAPVETAIWIFGINFAGILTARLTGVPWLDIIDTLNRVLVVVLLAWIALRFIRRGEANVLEEKHRNGMDRTTAQAVGKLLRFSVVITSALVVLQTMGISVSGVLAFGGIGGIAVGFAARDMLANFFGALTIYLDKPFAVGDWVRSPNQEIEGVVEEIGWRRTVIRTFDKRPLYVPNSVFNNISVENPSRMLNRRIQETIGVRYDDFALLEGILEEVREMLVGHPEIDTGQTLMVNFNKYGASSLDFFIYCFTRTTVWAEYHKVKEDVLLRIGRIIEKRGAEIAYPTSTVHLPGLQLPATPAEGAATA